MRVSMKPSARLLGVHHLELGPGGDVVGLRELAGEHSAEQADD